MTTEVVHLIALKLLILKINILLEEKIYILVKKNRVCECARAVIA